MAGPETLESGKVAADPDSAVAIAAPVTSRPRAVTLRALIICLLLLPINSFWVVQMEIVRYSAHPTTISILFNAVFILLVVTVANQVVRRYSPTRALERGELLLIYSIIAIGSVISGHDSLEVFVPMLSWTFKHADASNNWGKLINPHLRAGVFMADPSVFKGYYLGNDTIFRVKYIRAWLPIVCVWTIFVSTLLTVMLCVNAILRKQWTDNERLTYPIVQVPLQITSPDAFQPRGLFRSRLFWLGFCIAGAIDMVNSLNYYYPNIPTILTPGFGQSFLDIGPFFTQKPWNAIGWTPVSFYPFMIGLGMLMPLDFLFSMWFFYWFWKLQHVLAVAWAWDQDPRFPYTENQAFGAYMSFCVYSVWLSRDYLKQVLRKALGLSSTLDDSKEPMRYRTAVIGVVAGLAALVGFSSYLGMTWWIAVVFFFIYFALAIAITRMRAELGTPINDLHFTGPEMILTRVYGSEAFNKDTLTVFSIYFWFNRAYRCQPMPHQLESYKLAEQSRADFRRWTWAVWGLGMVATFVAFWVILGLMYHYGAEAKSAMTFGPEAFDQLTTWLKSPQPGRFPEAMAIIVGFGFAALLQWMRVQFPWWPFHPLAYAVTSSWEINLVWGPLFLAWIFKTLILRYGGRGGFHKSLPFFIGLMLGQFVVGSLWNIYGIARGLPTYQFWQ